MTIETITNDFLCSGCGTCYSICPRKAIVMVSTRTMGLLYASIDKNKCIDCGLCYTVCPSNGVLENRMKMSISDLVGNVKACYVGRSLDRNIYLNAQSGGIATAILKYLFEKKLIDAAVSCRMDYNKNIYRAIYYVSLSVDELYLNQKSCYTQVDIVSALCRTSQYKSVAVVGLPCQIDGVCKLLEKGLYKNVKYKIGLICDRAYSMKYVKAIISSSYNDQSILINYKLKNFTYRGVYYSYQHAPIVIRDRYGILDVIPRVKRVSLKDFFTLPRCRICYNKLNYSADIVLGDPWGLKGMYDEKEGDSLIIVRGVKMLELLFDMCKLNEIAIKSVNIDDVVKGQKIDHRFQKVCSVVWNDVKKDWQNKEMLTEEQVLRKTKLLYSFACFVEIYRSLKKLKLRMALDLIKSL